MADLAKLANLSKRLKSSKPKVNEDKSALGSPISAGDDDDAPVETPKKKAKAEDEAEATPAKAPGKK